MDKATTIENKAIPNMHPPKTPKQICTFLWLLGHYRKLIKNFTKIASTSVIINTSASQVWMDTNTSQCLLNTQGISNPSTNSTLCRSKEMLHSLHWCIRWCMWSITFSGTWWHRISHSHCLTHIHETQPKWSTTEQTEKHHHSR